MSLPLRLAAVFLITAVLQGSALAGDPANSPALLPFASDEGLERLARSTAKVDFPQLANQFEAQATIAFCGPTSAAIVLNALDPQGQSAPVDRSRLLPADALHLPPGRELTVRRHTQESVIANGKKTRAQVFGEPRAENGRVLRDGGYQLRQLDELLQAHRVRSRLVIVDAQKPEAEIRQDLIDNLGRANDFVLVNYHRPAVGQAGGGHISPLGAYDAQTDSVLVLDVNPSQHPWVWMPLDTLIKGMRTRDVVEHRGYILVMPVGS